MTIMIVDDNVRMRNVIRSLFEGSGALLVECSSGDEAVQRYDIDLPDWVLMDVRMQGLDGIAATRSIMMRHPDAKVIIVTEYADPALREAAALAGVRDFVEKENLLSLKNIITA